MRLWTCHPRSVWDALRREGALFCDAERSLHYGDFPECFDWMRGQMARRIAGYDPAHLPWWTWVKPKFDLRGWFARFPPSEPRYVRLELAVEPERALLSDFNAWHVPLNRGYLAVDEAEDDAWNAELERHGADPRFWPLPEPWHSRLLASWERVFDLSPSEYWSREYVQATFEELRSEDVVAVTEFTPRHSGRC